MLKEEGEIISRSERLRILTSILSKQFQYHKTQLKDSSYVKLMHFHKPQFA